MKKSAVKFLLAVPAFVIAASCAKEIAPEGAESANQPQSAAKVFTAVFESMDTKTTLSGLTPAWVAGDAIGITTADDANVSCALVDAALGTFNAEAVQGEAPFYAVYPYSDGNTFSGDVLTATIPATQTLAAGQNIAPGALVAACKSSTTTLQFKNCVSLLKIDIPRTDIKQVVVEATGTDEKLAGQFTMDLSATPLAPVIDAENSSASVTLLPEGTAFAAGTYYITVIPTAITALKVTFTNSADEEVSVSKTAATTFTRSAGVNLGTFFTYDITSAEDLIKWSKESAKYTVWDVVNLNADIVLTEEEAAQYIEAKNFRGLFDGHNHSISGLTCPLFGNLRSAEVKDLTMTANITWNGKVAGQFNGSDYGVGILAHYTYPRDEGNGYTRPSPKVTNVKTYGSLTVSGLSASHNFIVGGICGGENNVPYTNCENHADVTFAGGTITGSSAYLYVGGVAGSSQAGTSAVLTNCKNYGNVTVATSPGVIPFVGGVVGQITQAITHTGSQNYGKVEISSTFTATTSCYIGGICGLTTAAAKFVDCRNDGEVKNFATSTYAITGGLVGALRYDASYISNSVNNGKVTYGGTGSNRVDVGGIIGMSGNNATNQKSGGYYLQNVTNNGEIVVTGTAGSSADQFRIGGMIGNAAYGGWLGVNSSKTATPCYNNGDITISSPQVKHIRVGGICGSTTSVKAELYNMHNTGNIAVNITNDVTCQQVDCGGMVGYLGTGPFLIQDCDTKCAITKTGTVTANNFATMLGRTGTSNVNNKITDCGVGGSLLGTAITDDNKDTDVWKNKPDAAVITVTGTYLAE